MLTTSDFAKIFETVLCIPGMQEPVKVELKIPRKNVLLLTKVIERGLSAKDADEKGGSILQVASKETLGELAAICGELLQKAGLTDMNEKLKSF